MRTESNEIPGSRRKSLLTAVVIAGLVALAFLGLKTEPWLLAQSPAIVSPSVPQWQIDAGGKMVFDVASIKENKSDQTPYTNIPLGPGDLYTPTGGLFSATNFPMTRYIEFSYKLTGRETPSFRQQMPKWASNHFDIQARARRNVTKDQIRLMLQSLFAERLKLKVHYETRQMAVYAMVLTNSGKMGTQLQPHPTNSPCSNERPMVAGLGTAPAPSPPIAGGFPTACGGQVGMEPSVPGRYRIGARNVSMSIIASYIAGITDLDRPVIDGTGLGGNYDFFIEWVPEPDDPSSSDPQVGANGPSVAQAVREQLGLKLEPRTGSVNVLVVDHVEEPSPN